MTEKREKQRPEGKLFDDNDEVSTCTCTLSEISLASVNSTNKQSFDSTLAISFFSLTAIPANVGL